MVGRWLEGCRRDGMDVGCCIGYGFAGPGAGKSRDVEVGSGI